MKVKRFIVSETVEEKMVELQKRKRLLAEEVMKSGSTASSNFSAYKLELDDFKTLFQ